MNNKYPRLLIFSNNCFSKTGSNGRTLAMLMGKYPKDRVAQFYIQSEIPDFDVCANYFQLTDSEVLRALFTEKQPGKIVEQGSVCKHESNGAKHKRKKRRTPFSMLIREVVWKSNRWKGSGFLNWVNEFSPEIVMVQAGDNAFLLKIATDISVTKSIPLVIYNSENYYFKHRNYMKDSGIAAILFPFFMSQFRKQFKLTMNRVAYAIYNCDPLRQEYDKEFHCPSSTIYTSSSFPYSTEKKDKKGIVISYLGNLGVGRDESLIEVAEALQSINPEFKLNVYGKAPNNQIENRLLMCKGICYKGFISYQEVISVIKQSDILIQVESFSKKMKDDLKFAFSTKIADYLSSGVCIFNYAPIELASTKYLSDNNVACVVTNKEDLQKQLKNLIYDEDLRQQYIERAIVLSRKNHNAQLNGEKFCKIIEDTVYAGNADKLCL